MSRRGKEEDRIEKIIRGLLKLPDNRRCINCNSLGPQYVCTTYWTFICTSCSGIHREFNHRVKSVSMAKFNAEEISCLQAAGNERAKQIYFKTWDPQRNSYPEPRNLHRLREFIGHVYVDRKYSGGRDSDKLAMVKVNPKDERRSFEMSGNWAKQEEFGRRSYEKPFASGKIELRNFLEERSPRFKEIEKTSSGRKSRSKARFEVVDDRFKDDGCGSARRSRLASGSLSPDSQKNRENGGALQGVRSLQEIMGITFPDTPKANDRRDSDVSSTTEGKVAEQKIVSVSSLIDFTEPDSPQPSNQLEITTIDTGNASSQSEALSNMNSVESLLFGLSSPVENALALVPTSSGDDMVNTTDGQLTSTMHPHQLSWPSHAPNCQRPPEQLHQPFPSPAQEASSENGSQMSGRKELPVDIFALSYSEYDTPVADNSEYHPTYGMGYQYQHPSAEPSLPNRARSTNPFDLGDDNDTPPQDQIPFALTQPPFPPSSYSMNIPSGAYMGQQHPNNMLVSRPQGNDHNAAFASFNPVQHPNNSQSTFGSGGDQAAFASLNPLQLSGRGSHVPQTAPNSYISSGGNPFG